MRSSWRRAKKSSIDQTNTCKTTKSGGRVMNFGRKRIQCFWLNLQYLPSNSAHTTIKSTAVNRNTTPGRRFWGRKLWTESISPRCQWPRIQWCVTWLCEQHCWLYTNLCSIERQDVTHIPTVLFPPNPRHWRRCLEVRYIHIIDLHCHSLHTLSKGDPAPVL